ncbi:MAG TPA: tetratricopeptide repeat protein [Longimicrobiaceae bacterium]|nr:tetratricopeptide repeat protein [Longimicrobiaceae bacterium]
MIRMRLLLSVVLVAFALLGLLAFERDAGNRYYQEGNFERAAAEYQRALERGNGLPTLHYNLGTALLRLGRYDEARQHLELATRAAEAEVRQRAHYNAGNTDLEPAFRAPATEARREQLQRAVTAYREALRLDPADEDAKWNLELAERLLQQPTAEGGGGGGGGGPDQQSPAQPDPQPSPAEGGGAGAELTPAQARQILQAAEQIERELQREKLRRAEAPPPNVRDW